MQEEIWKEIENFNDYMISNKGNAISLKYNKVRFISKRIDKKGYINYKLCKNGKCYSFKAHRLVAQAFIPNPNNKPQINHIDGNKQNNYVENLEWCNNSENQLHALKIGLRTLKLYSENPNAKPIIQYSKNNEFIKKWSCIREASETLKIHHSAIVNTCRGKYKTAGGYIWKYADK